MDKELDRWNMIEDTGNTFLDQMHYMASKNRGGVSADASQLEYGRGPSNSEVKAARSAGGQHVSSEGFKKLSQTRQEYMSDLNERAREDGKRPDLGIAAGVRGYGSFVKQAMTSGAGGGNLASSSNTVHLAPNIYSPLFLMQNLQLPRDRITANAWNRAFYETNPIVRNAINLHATYPISKLSIKCEDRQVEKFFQDMMDRTDLEQVVQDVALEYTKLGEAFVYAAFDEGSGMWDQIYLHNPDYIRVKASPIPSKVPAISLRPDPELQRIINSSDPEHIKVREQIDPKIIDHVIRNEYIPLDSFNISHLKNLASPYDVRGTSMIVSVWKHLMLWDKYFESKLVQADGMINPLTLIKIGAAGPDGFYPRQEELETWRQVFETGQYDKDFKIVTHDAVNVERVGFSGSTLDISGDLQMIIDNILIGLMIPKSVITQEGASYASASVALDVMRQRYLSFRNKMANWLEKKIFAPIAEVQGFYKLDGGKKRLIVPQIEWNHMTLYDMDNYIAQISTLVDKQRVSQRTLDRSLGLNRHNEQVAIREESIERAIQMKEQQALNQMNLAQLRSLDPEEPVVPQEKDPLPGTPGGPGGGAGMGGMMGGSPFDMGMGGGLGGDLMGGGLGGGLGGPPLAGLPPPGGGGGGMAGPLPGGPQAPLPPI